MWAGRARQSTQRESPPTLPPSLDHSPTTPPPPSTACRDLRLAARSILPLLSPFSRSKCSQLPLNPTETRRSSLPLAERAPLPSTTTLRLLEPPTTIQTLYTSLGPHITHPFGIINSPCHPDDPLALAQPNLRPSVLSTQPPHPPPPRSTAQNEAPDRTTKTSLLPHPPQHNDPNPSKTPKTPRSRPTFPTRASDDVVETTRPRTFLKSLITMSKKRKMAMPRK